MPMEQWIADVKKWAGSWPDQAKPWFIDTWGLSPTFAIKAALLYLILTVMGLKPKVTSGFRDPKKQRELIKQWDALKASGKDPLKHGFIGKPASPDTSRHCRTTITGGPASTAIDMPCSDNMKASHIAKALGLRAGVDFNDPGHYDMG